MELFTQQEIAALLALLNRLPMTPAEQLFAQSFFQRLVAFCQPSKPEPEKKETNEAETDTDPNPSSS